MKLIDFDKKYQQYALEWVRKNSKKLTPVEMEERIAEVYTQWSHELDKELNMSAAAYFSTQSDEELVKSIQDYATSKLGLPEVLTDEVAVRHSCDEKVATLLQSDREELQILGINLLNEMGSSLGVPTMINWLTNVHSSESQREVSCEFLGDYADEVAKKVLDHLSEYTIDVKELVADILVRAGKDERIFNLLKELFQRSKDTPLIADYLGRYGDERALPLLLEKIQSVEINYLSYVELKNAIERLGGEAPVVNKDFSDDEYFKLYKTCGK